MADLFGVKQSWIKERNSVKIGSSCAAVTGYDFPYANFRVIGDQGGEEDGGREPSEKPEVRILP